MQAQPAGMWRLAILALVLLAACGAGPAALPSEAEAGLLARGDVTGYWQARERRGDPVAPVALAVLDPQGRRGLWHGIAANALQGQAPVDPGALALAIARGHHAALLEDRTGTPARLSAAQVAAYHHRVMAAFGLPRTAFGGTQLTGTLAEARLTAPLWCPACDRAP